MDSAISIQDLVQREPWRAGQLWLLSALDPTWSDAQPVQCDGQVEWDQNGRWWYCTSCGYCSFWSNTRHYKAKHPYDIMVRNVILFLKKRLSQGLTTEQAFLQLAHAIGAVAGALLNYQPDDLLKFIERLRKEE
jgi:hypothetical protein